MNKLGCLIMMFITCGVCRGQNLVPNGSFEQYTSCPTGVNQIDSCLFWICPQICSSDYFNQCADSSSSVGVPVNFIYFPIRGYQYPNSGLGYAGIFLWIQSVINYREYIEGTISQPLNAGACYHFEMYINLSNNSKFTNSDIGVYFTDTLITGMNFGGLMAFTPSISNTNGNNPDTLNWILVSGNYTAVGGESYFLIGNFKDDLNTDTILINSIGSDRVYVYIDDVCLTPCGSLCTTGIEEQSKMEQIKIYPNPVINKLNATAKGNEPVEINLFDITSRKIFNQTFTNSTSINTEQLAKGIYLYELRNKNGVVKKGKVVKD
ncbi:MAG: T9SS type A sorting domain-containing protein [Bacteroidia bacterium]